MTLLLVSGNAGSGKSTLSTYIIDKYGYCGFGNSSSIIEFALADKLKQLTFEILKLFGIQIDSIQDLYTPGKKEQYRKYLQGIGTECCRKVFGDNFWCEMTYLDIMNKIKDENCIIISDIRYINEQEYFMKTFEKKCQIIRIKVVRTDKEDMKMNENEMNHSSEMEIDDLEFDYVIENNGTNDFFTNIDDFMKTTIDSDEFEDYDEEVENVKNENDDLIIFEPKDSMNKQKKNEEDKQTMNDVKQNIQNEKPNEEDKQKKNEDKLNENRILKEHIEIICDELIRINYNFSCPFSELSETIKDELWNYNDIPYTSSGTINAVIREVINSRNLNEFSNQQTSSIPSNQQQISNQQQTSSAPSNQSHLTSIMSSIVSSSNQVSSYQLGRIGEDTILHMIEKVRPAYDTKLVSSTGHIGDIHSIDYNTNIKYMFEIKLKQSITKEDVSKFEKDVENIQNSDMTYKVIGIFISIISDKIPSIGNISISRNKIYLTKNYVSENMLELIFNMIETYHTILESTGNEIKSVKYEIPENVLILLSRLRAEYATLNQEKEIYMKMKSNTENNLVSIQELLGKLLLKEQFVKFINEQFSDILPVIEPDLVMTEIDRLREYVRNNKNWRLGDVKKLFPTLAIGNKKADVENLLK